jgi:hypothetical protein
MKLTKEMQEVLKREAIVLRPDGTWTTAAQHMLAAFEAWERDATEAEFMKLAASGVKPEALVEAVGRYARHVERTGEESISPIIWLRDGHWKNWILN